MAPTAQSLKALAQSLFVVEEDAPAASDEGRGTLVTFSDVVLWKLSQVAHYRNDPKLASAHVRNRRVDPERGDLEINVQGLMGEYAVARLLGEPFDLGIDLEGDGGVVDLYCGERSVQVKFNNTPSGDLYFTTATLFRADVAVLVVKAGRNAVRVIGFATRERFQREQEVRDYGHGRVAALPQEKLEPIERLVAHGAAWKVESRLWVECRALQRLWRELEAAHPGEDVKALPEARVQERVVADLFHQYDAVARGALHADEREDDDVSVERGGGLDRQEDDRGPLA
jgi:hypothetical protein